MVLSPRAVLLFVMCFVHVCVFFYENVKKNLVCGVFRVCVLCCFSFSSEIWKFINEDNLSTLISSIQPSTHSFVHSFSLSPYSDETQKWAYVRKVSILSE